MAQNIDAAEFRENVCRRRETIQSKRCTSVSFGEQPVDPHPIDHAKTGPSGGRGQVDRLEAQRSIALRAPHHLLARDASKSRKCGRNSLAAKRPTVSVMIASPSPNEKSNGNILPNRQVDDPCLTCSERN